MHHCQYYLNAATTLGCPHAAVSLKKGSFKAGLRFAQGVMPVWMKLINTITLFTVKEDEPPQCPHTAAALTTGSVPQPVPTGFLTDPIELYADFRRLRCRKASIPRPLSIMAQVDGSGTAITERTPVESEKL